MAGWYRRPALTHVCVHQVSDGNGSAAAWQHMALTSSGPPLLFAGGADGRVSLFDLRAPADAAAACIRLGDGHLVRMPPAANGRPQSALSSALRDQARPAALGWGQPPSLYLHCGRVCFGTVQQARPPEVVVVTTPISAHR